MSKQRLCKHAAALAASRDPLSIAEDLLHKQQHNLELQQQLKHVLTNQRRLEVELSSLRQYFASTQQQQQQQVQPDDGHQLAPVLLAGSQPAGAANLLQQELREAQQQACHDQALAGHFACVLQHVRGAAEEAAASAADADADADSQPLARQLLDILEAFEAPAVAPSPCSTPVSSLAVAQSAHKLLLQQLVLLRGKLAACPSSSSSQPAHKARELLCFLRHHTHRMQALLQTLPSGAGSPAEAAAAAHVTAAPAARPRTASPKRSLRPAQQPQRPGSAMPGAAGSCSVGADCVAGSIRLTGTPAGATAGSRKQQQPYQLTASAPDLRPYLQWPPRRPGSALAVQPTAAHEQEAPRADADTDMLLVQQLQDALADRDVQLACQQQEWTQAQQQLRASEAAVRTLQGQAAEAAQASGTLSQQLADAQQQLEQCRQQCGELQAQVQQLQDSSPVVGSLQQALAAAEAQVQDLQLQLHVQQVQHIQAQAELTAKLDAAVAATAAAGRPQEAGGVVSSSAQLAQLLQSHAATLSALAPDHLVTAAAELQSDVLALCDGMRQLLGVLAQVASGLLPERGDSSASAAGRPDSDTADADPVGRCSGNTESLVCEVEQTGAAVAQCMERLQEVAAATRRVTAVGLLGPAPAVKRFSQLDLPEWQLLPSQGDVRVAGSDASD